ncbi:MAG: hypothetical protein V1843_04080 [bacterium]
MKSKEPWHIEGKSKIFGKPNAKNTEGGGGDAEGGSGVLLPYVIFPVIIIAAIVAGILVISGLMSDITFHKGIKGPYVLVYKQFKGDEHEIPDIQNKIYSSLLTNRVESYRKFIVKNYRGANAKIADRWYLVGCIIEREYYYKTNVIRLKHNVIMIGGKPSIYVTFPYKTPLSPIIAEMRVLPAIEAFRIERGLKKTPILEIFDERNGTITYIMDIKRARHR